MIARIHTPQPSVRKLLYELLCKIGQLTLSFGLLLRSLNQSVSTGKAHPQALVYALTVASKAPQEARKAAALNVLTNMRTHSQVLVRDLT